MTPRIMQSVKNKKFRIFWIALIGGLLSALLPAAAPQSTAAVVGSNTHIAEYMQANWNSTIARGIPYPANTEPMVLRGSWYQMGQQYGQTAGKYIRIVYDGYYGLWRSSGLDPNKLGAILDWYKEEAKKLTPEMVDFARGISDGAAADLNGAIFAAALTNMQKIMLINCLFEVVVPPAWPHVAELMGMSAPPQTNVAFEAFASHTWAAWGNMTSNGHALMGGTRDQPWFPTLYNVSYIAIPSDKKAGITWSNTIAGVITANATVNEYGVGMGNTIVSPSKQYFGVPVIFTTAYISFFAHSAREAADIYTVGTPGYRRKTGRATLASTIGLFEAFGDPDESLVVERTGRNYAVRKAGTLDEPGKYVVLPNHALTPYSKNESGKLTGKPMVDWTVPSDPSASTWSRYWALLYECKNHKGDIDLKFAREKIATMKTTYTSDGQLVTEKDGIPVWRLGLTPERWLIPNPADPNSFPTGGNNMYFVTDLTKREVFWVQGIPSHWEGPWEHVSLRDFKR